MAKTLFEKIWDTHVVKTIDEGPSVLYIDKHFIHEVTSPQAFKGLEDRGLPVFRPAPPERRSIESGHRDGADLDQREGDAGGPQRQDHGPARTRLRGIIGA